MKIPLYCLFTPSHRVLKEQYFEPSLPSDVELHSRFCEIEGTGVFHDASWRQAIACKVEFILEAIERERQMGGAFVFSDVDVQFFGSFANWFHRSVASHDIAFQVDAPGPALCTGFFFCRANARTRQLWQEVLQVVRATEGHDDDQAVAQRLAGRIPGMTHACLPPIFCGGGTLSGRCWHPGETLAIPEGLLMHHANFTIGVPNKIQQLEHVRELVKQGRCIRYSEACERAGTGHPFDESQTESKGTPLISAGTDAQ